MYQAARPLSNRIFQPVHTEHPSRGRDNNNPRNKAHELSARHLVEELFYSWSDL
jgi:hypothetical protein